MKSLNVSAQKYIFGCVSLPNLESSGSSSESEGSVESRQIWTADRLFHLLFVRKGRDALPGNRQKATVAVAVLLVQEQAAEGASRLI